jgi:hypothetical protein
VVGEKVCGSVDREVRKRASPIASVGSNRVIEARATEWVHDCEIISIRSLGHCDKLLELGDIQGYWVATRSS